MKELGTHEAARAYDANPVQLIRLIAQGRLEARKDENGRWRISQRSLEEWNRKRLARRKKNATGNGSVGAAAASA